MLHKPIRMRLVFPGEELLATPKVGKHMLALTYAYYYKLCLLAGILIGQAQMLAIVVIG
jgi:hypothetical protein